MAIWRLTPDPGHLDHPFWARSLDKEGVTIVAPDEGTARSTVAQEKDIASPKIPGADTTLPPWMIPSLVRAEVIQFDLGPY